MVNAISECWQKTGKAPVCFRWVDTDKGHYEGDRWIPLVRCRVVARDFKVVDNNRDDLFAETLTLECERMILSRAATRKLDRRKFKVMLIDATEAHINPG